MNKEINIKFSSVRRLIQYALRYKWRLFFGLISGVAVGGSMFGLLNSLGSVFESGKSVVDAAASSGNILDDVLTKMGFEKTNADGTLTFAFTLITILAFPIYIGFKGFFTYTNRYFMRWVGGRVVNDLRNDLFQNISNQSLHFYSKSEVGSLVSRIMNDSGMVDRMISSSISDLTRCPMEIIAVFSFIIYQAIKLQMHSVTITLMVLIPICFIPFILISRKIKKYAYRALGKTSELTTHMLETFTGIRVVKAYHMEEAEVERFKKTNESCFRQMILGLRAELLISPVMEFAGVCGMIGFLAYAYSTGLRFDQIAPFGVAAMFLYQPLKTIGKVMSELQRSMVGAERVFNYIDLVPELQDSANAVEVKEFKDSFKFKNVSFSYKSDAPEVIKDISFEIKPGEMIAFVGATGSGKTTVSNLLARFYDPTKGEITLDGVNLRDIKIQSLRQLIGVVTQDAIMFNSTIAYNIAYGSVNISSEDIENAAKRANAHDFIVSESEGYDRIVGEKGFRLSGGQKQRISIARALLKNPPILILDEATSALDTKTEQLVQDALTHLMESRTVFAIAHRLSTIRHANKICVLEAGQIVEMGTHDELYAKNGRYRELYDVQFNTKASEIE